MTTQQLPVRKNVGWTDKELEYAIQVYLELLSEELKGSPVSLNKAITSLQGNLLSARSWRSVELRMQNISSVLYDLNYPRVSGCAPAVNVGTGVKGRIAELLNKHGLQTLMPYAKTSNRREFEERVLELRRKKTLRKPEGSLEPEYKITSRKSFVRDPAVKAWILENAKGVCEGCRLPAPFTSDEGFPYLEVHHVVQLSNHGSDTVTNTVALCPNCHMCCHHSRARDEFKLHLYENIDRLVIEVPQPLLDPVVGFVDIERLTD
jgi:5-methylcytosine-specific restriction protein A